MGKLYKLVCGTKCGNVVIFVLSALIFIFFSYRLREIGGSEGVPNYFELAYFIAPGITFGVASTAVFRFIFMEDQHANEKYDGFAGFIILNIILLLTLSVLCFELASRKGWFAHLKYLGLIYLALLVWDRIVLRMFRYGELKSPQLKSDVEQGSIFINIPTLTTVVLITSYLYLGDILIIPKDDVSDLGAAIDNITYGAVLFHLVFGGVGYLFVTLGPDPS